MTYLSNFPKSITKSILFYHPLIYSIYDYLINSGGY